MIDAPGIYAISAEEYHADPAVEPSLSASIAKILCADTPLHAWHAHPRLNPDYRSEEKEIFDLGTICHSLLLEGESKAEVLPFDDWRKKEARDAKIAAREAGLIPILGKHWDRCQAMLVAAREQLSNHKQAADAFTKGKPEQTLVWFEKDYGVWCRARLDWLHDSLKKIDDYKSTGITANPDVISRSMFSQGWDIQAALYLRGLRAVTGSDASFRFVAQESDAPYALSVIGVGPDVATIGEKKALWALETFSECLHSGVWPGYPKQICYPVLPEWEEQKWLRKEEEAVNAV